jgi:hypothetical protein
MTKDRYMTVDGRRVPLAGASREEVMATVEYRMKQAAGEIRNLRAILRDYVPDVDPDAYIERTLGELLAPERSSPSSG